MPVRVAPPTFSNLHACVSCEKWGGGESDGGGEGLWRLVLPERQNKDKTANPPPFSFIGKRGVGCPPPSSSNGPLPPPLHSFILIFSPALPYHNLDYENNPCLKGKGDLEKTCLFLRHALVERSSTNVKKNNKSPPFPR
nr:hypothetical protein [Morchella crassipes]